MARRKKNATIASEDRTFHSHPAFFDDEQHHEALEQLTLSALSAGDAERAFRYADRRCRISPVAQAHHFTLRAEATYRLGDRQSALRDLHRALDLLPEDLAANRRILSWGNDLDKEQAAAILVQRETNLDALAPAVAFLRKHTKRKTFAAVQGTDRCIFGWAAWSGRTTLTVQVAVGNEAVATTIDADPDHPLKKAVGRAASFRIPRPAASAVQTVSCFAGSTAFYEKILPTDRSSDVTEGSESASGASGRLGGRRRNAATSTDSNSLTIIVPVYDDYDATKACLDSLMADLQEQRHCRLLIVDDAAPDRRISELLVELSRHERIQLIRNERNLGFVESVNRALAEIATGDIILLNADTIVPPGFATRLRDAARSRPYIGTVVPLSNNGEFTSLPVPNTPNPIGSPEEIATLDRAAARANAGTLVDIPNGTGFCMYVTRACLDAVGRLSDVFERGYLEDADFCLRAREAGLASVCCPSVYVGHAGSRSFKTEKRALVMRNMGRLEARYPGYRNECAMFIKADPLQGSRAAIETQVAGLSAGAIVLVSGPGAIGDVARLRAEQLAQEGVASVIVEIGPTSPHIARIMHPSDGFPQSLALKMQRTEDLQTMAEYVEKLQPARIEFIGPSFVPPPVLELLTTRGVSFDVTIASGHFVQSGLSGETGPDSSHAALNDLLGRADRIVVFDDRAAAFAKRHLTARTVATLDVHSTGRLATLGSPEKNARALGLLAIEQSAADYELIRAVAAAVTGRPGIEAVVIGRTLNDLELMKPAGISVTGPVELDEMRTLARRFGLKALFVTHRQPLFGHPAICAALRSQFPVAFLDWSSGQIAPARGSLALDPALENDEIGRLIAKWMARP